MARFIVRVELLQADSDDYTLLHKRMQEAGFSRTIQDGAGTWFNLPTAEYTALKSTTAYQVREDVKSIAQRIKTKFYILVSECSDTSWWLATN